MDGSDDEPMCFLSSQERMWIVTKQIYEEVFQHGVALILRKIYRLQFIFLPVVKKCRSQLWDVNFRFYC